MPRLWILCAGSCGCSDPERGIQAGLPGQLALANHAARLQGPTRAPQRFKILFSGIPEGFRKGNRKRSAGKHANQTRRRFGSWLPALVYGPLPSKSMCPLGRPLAHPLSKALVFFLSWGLECVSGAGAARFWAVWAAGAEFPQACRSREGFCCQSVGGWSWHGRSLKSCCGARCNLCGRTVGPRGEISIPAEQLHGGGHVTPAAARGRELPNPELHG